MRWLGFKDLGAVEVRQVLRILVKGAFWKVVLVSSGPMGTREVSCLSLKWVVATTHSMLQMVLLTSGTICSGNKVHLRLCLPPLGAVSCFLCWAAQLC